MKDNKILSQFSGSSQKKGIEQGEELLHEVYTVTQQPGNQIVLAGVDGGSTQTRVGFLFPSDLEDGEKLAASLETRYSIPSVSWTVLDERVIQHKSDTLYDNMDADITDTSGRKPSMVGAVRVVRGTKGLNTESQENSLGSSTQKTADPSFYYNLIEGVAYGLIQKNQGSLPESIDLYLGVALPPDDTREINANNFRESFKEFKWHSRVYNVSTTIRVKSVDILTEPEAFIKAYYALRGEDIPAFVMHVEGGGRSLGTEILVDGKSLDTAQKTIDFGGTQLLNAMNDLYLAKFGGSSLRRPVLEEAVRTGKVRSGNNRIDISDIIRQAKTTMAATTHGEIKKRVFDGQRQVAVTDLNAITVSGRLFDAGDYEFSIADELEKLYKADSPDTDFSRVEGNFITTGLLLEVYLNQFASSAEDEAAPALE